MNDMSAKSGNKKRLAVMLAVLAIMMLVVFIALHSHLHLDKLEELLHITTKKSAATGNLTMTVKLQPISRSITLTGHIGPGHIENIPAPFNGTIKNISFNYDASVARGDALLELDTAEIQFRMWDAESAYLAVKQKYEEILTWRTGAEVQFARRQLNAAQEGLMDSERKRHETKILYDKGIVSRNDYQSSIETLDNQQRALETAKANLHATLEKGSNENIKINKLQLNSAKTKLDSLRRKMAESVVKAPFEGVVVLPFQSKSSDSGTQSQRLSLGNKVNGNDPLLGIADLTTYSVEAKVDEIEVNKLQVGQTATITGEAFPGIRLNGRVNRISQEAIVSQNRNGLANFKVWVIISELTEDQRRLLRIGMSAHMAIVIYSNPKAIVLPISAVHGDPGQSWVFRQSQNDARPERVKITTGITTLSGVEVLSGLKAGDQVSLSHEDAGS